MSDLLPVAENVLAELRQDDVTNGLANACLTHGLVIQSRFTHTPALDFCGREVLAVVAARAWLDAISLIDGSTQPVQGLLAIEPSLTDTKDAEAFSFAATLDRSGSLEPTRCMGSRREVCAESGGG